MVLSTITFPGTFSIVVLFWTEAVVAVSVSRVMLKVFLFPGVGTVPERTILFMRKLLVLALRFLFCGDVEFWIVRGLGTHCLRITYHPFLFHSCH